MVFDDDNNNEYEYDGDEYDEDDGFLNTASDLLDRLDDLPPKCDNFVVKFKDVDGGSWMRPEYWEIDGDKVVFSIYNDGDDHVEFSVGDLKLILAGGDTDDNGNSVWKDALVAINGVDYDNESRILDERFKIKWKQKIVEIPVSSSEEDDDNEDEDEDEDEYEDDEDDEDEDDEDDAYIYLETAGELYEKLDELPRKCRHFNVRFKDIDDGDWVQPERWRIDEDGDLILDIYDDGCDHDDDEITVAELKNILAGNATDNDDNVVEEETRVYVDLSSDDGNYRCPLDEFFPINWKRRFVVIPVRSSEDDD